ncbi:MAG: hypothetical protein V4658_06635 [Bacteroidota bacterium]
MIKKEYSSFAVFLFALLGLIISFIIIALFAWANINVSLSRFLLVLFAAMELTFACFGIYAGIKNSPNQFKAIVFNLIGIIGNLFLIGLMIMVLLYIVPGNPDLK